MDKIKRGSKRNFTIVQNIIFSLEISVYAKLVYVYLNKCADEEGQAFPSYNTIAENCSCSRRKAIEAIKELKEICLLEVQQRKIIKEGKPSNTSNLYTIYDEPTTLVQEVHHPSAGDAPPLVQEMHHPSARHAPNQYPINNTQFINNQSINQSYEVQSTEVKPKEDEMDRGNKKDSDKREKKKTPFPAPQKKASNQVASYATIDAKTIIAENISYDQLMNRYLGYKRDMLQSLFELILDVMTSRKDSERINGQDIPLEQVKKVFEQLNQFHVEYVIECLDTTTTKIHNLRSYILTALDR